MAFVEGCVIVVIVMVALAAAEAYHGGEMMLERF